MKNAEKTSESTHVARECIEVIKEQMRTRTGVAAALMILAAISSARAIGREEPIRSDRVGSGGELDPSASSPVASPQVEVAQPTRLRPSSVLGEFAGLGEPVHLTPTAVLGEYSGGVIYRPAAIDFDDAGNLYVLADDDYCILVFSPDGHFLRSFGRRGSGPGEFSAAGTDLHDDLAISGDLLAVVEVRTRLVHLLRTDGSFLALLRTEGQTPGSVSIIGDAIYVTLRNAEPDAPEILVFDLEGEQVAARGTTLVDATRSNVGRRLNHSFSAASEAGDLLLVYRTWPLVKMYTVGGGQKSVWLDLMAVDMALLTEAAMERRRAFQEPPETWLNFEFTARMGFGVARIEQADSWLVLLNGGIAQLLAHNLDLLQTLSLGAPDPDPGRVATTDIAVSPDARRLCAIDRLEHRVLCYDIDRITLEVSK